MLVSASIVRPQFISPYSSSCLNSMTSLATRLGLSVPLIQAPMAGVSNAVVAAEVAKAGALASLPLSPIDLGKSVEPVFELVAKFRQLAGMAAAPVNLNFFCFDPALQPQPAPAAWDSWRAVYTAAGEGERALKVSPGARAVVSFREFVEARLPLLAQFLQRLVALRPQVVLFHFGVPDAETIATLRKGGILVLATATSVPEARVLLAAGVDAIVCQGYEAGGHRGHFLEADGDDECLSTQALFLQVRALLQSALSQVHIIPAGGIANAATAGWYMQNGAAAVQVGTAFIPVTETSAPPFISDCIAGSRGLPTVMTSAISGRAARTIKTPFVARLVAAHRTAENFPLFGYATSAYREFAAGRPDYGFYLAGQNYHLVEAGVTAKSVVERIGAGLRSCDSKLDGRSAADATRLK